MAGVILMFLAGQVLMGALSVGVSVDEPTHLDRFEQWLDTGWYVPERFMADGAPDPEIERSTPFVYGVAFSVVAHAANVIVGNEAWGEVSRSSESYAVRHSVVAALGLVAAGAVGLAVKAATKDRLAALWSASAILAIPAWTGHSMFNIKDIPAATGYSLLTASLVMSLTRSTAATTSPWRQFGVAVLAGSGIFFGAGTRTAMWLPMSLSLVTFTGLSVLAYRDHNMLARAVVTPLVGSIAGLIAVVALHPNNAATPVRWFVGAVADSSEYPWSGYTLTAGELLSERPPLWYWPAWLGASIPILIAVAAVLGIAAVVTRLIRPYESLSIHHRLSDASRTAPLLVLQQAILLPLAVIISGAITYTGLRQHLYILPAFAMLAGIGVAHLLRHLVVARGEAPAQRRWIAGAAVAVLALALAKPAIEETRLFPYNYVYINALGGREGINGRWETDYWGISRREALRRVPQGADLRCSSWLVRAWDLDGSPRIRECDERHHPYADEIGRETRFAAGDHVWVVGLVRAGNRPPEFCTEVDNVTRPMRGEQVLVSFVLNCDAEAMD